MNRRADASACFEEGCEKLNRYPMPPIQSRREVPEDDSSGVAQGVAPPAALVEARSGEPEEEHPDVRLVNLAKAGDVHAFETLVKQYDRQVFRIAQHITQNREDAEDVVQDAFLKAYEKLNQFQGNSKFYTWLVRIAVNESLMRLRKRRTGKMVSIDEDIATDEGSMPRELADWGPSPEQQYGQSELAEILKKTVNGLPPGFRVVFVLRDVEGLSTEETAETLGLSIPAVKSRLLRARLQLRERLNRYFGKKNGDGGAK
jgi:RNA polymerase sigma-70 factor (ECF subfamily)